MNMQLLKSDTSRYIAFFGVLLLLMLLGRFEFTHQLVINIALIFVFAVISYVDWQTHRIPNILLLPLAALALILVLMQPGTAWMRLAGGIFAFVPFMLTAVVRPKHLGGGDIKLATLLGLLFGFPAIVWVLLVAVLSGGLIAAMMLITKRGNFKTEIAYAPFLCFGALVILFVMPFAGI